MIKLSEVEKNAIIAFLAFAATLVIVWILS
jgi:hypothetical protein